VQLLLGHISPAALLGTVNLFGPIQQDLTQCNEYDEPDDRREEYTGKKLSINHSRAVYNSAFWRNAMF
jgi:hypothetical protein